MRRKGKSGAEGIGAYPLEWEGARYRSLSCSTEKTAGRVTKKGQNEMGIKRGEGKNSAKWRATSKRRM